MTREEIKLLITENKLDDAVNEIFKAFTSAFDMHDNEGWISVFENPPKHADNPSISTGEFLCMNDWGWMMVASIHKKSETEYTGYQKSGNCLSRVTHYMKLPGSPPTDIANPNTTE